MRSWYSHCCWPLVVLAAAGVWAIADVTPSRGAEESLPAASSPAATKAAPVSVRAGGIVAESYQYHRGQPMRSAIERGGMPQATGWYNYGFPMQSYRWGYFGAERHYPRVLWHTGWYGDCTRTSYRYGY